MTQDARPTHDPPGTGAALLALLGGAANVRSVADCMTRLRVEVHDPAAVDGAALRARPGVLGVVADGPAWQIVLGPGTVGRVARELHLLLAPPPPDRGRLLLRRIAQIFVPLIPALVGCGIIAGLAGLLANLHLLPALVPALTAIAGGFMSLIAVLVGYQTAKEFGGTPILGAAVAAVVVHPGVARVDAFGLSLTPGQGGVLGALAAALLATGVERTCRRIVPEALDTLVTPFLTVLLPGLVTLYGLMFAAGEISSATGHLADRLLTHGGAAAGFVLGALFLPLVMLGLHQALIPLHTTLITETGSTVLLPILAMAGAGQVGAALAVYVRLRGDADLRRTIRSALPAGLLGIGEPLVYGVSLPLGRPFVTACVGGACGGGVVGLLHQLGHTCGATAIGPSGWALFPLLRGSDGLLGAAAVYGAGLLTGYAAGFGATYAFGLRRVLRAGGRAPAAG
ncbi:PTS transporter subunit EIIC [Streptomyces sp. NPDC049555]|uniref:PTS transporter subunit EIIC n=1 Tax=unclassified Streptomyces TaxID=2593676 RepID=UPI003440A441